MSDDSILDEHTLRLLRRGEFTNNALEKLKALSPHDGMAGALGLYERLCRHHNISLDTAVSSLRMLWELNDRDRI